MKKLISRPFLMTQEHESYLELRQDTDPSRLSVYLRRDYPHLDKIEAEAIVTYWLLRNRRRC